MGSLKTLLILLSTSAILLSCSVSPSTSADQVPTQFVELTEYFARYDVPLHIELRYFGSDNFVGEAIDGYNHESVYITRSAAEQLLVVAKRLQQDDLALKIFDAYRPQQAVDHFVRWAQDIDDTRMKDKYYPDVKKSELFDKGYIASRSGHSRGSTVDLTLVNLASGKELDMGTSWDFFDPSSWPSSEAVSIEQKNNRLLLRDAMLQAEFTPLAEEWWHFTLSDEPFPRTYFNFEIR